MQAVAVKTMTTEQTPGRKSWPSERPPCWRPTVKLGSTSAPRMHRPRLRASTGPSQPPPLPSATGFSNNHWEVCHHFVSVINSSMSTERSRKLWPYKEWPVNPKKIIIIIRLLIIKLEWTWNQKPSAYTGMFGQAVMGWRCLGIAQVGIRWVLRSIVTKRLIPKECFANWAAIPWWPMVSVTQQGKGFF